MGVINVDSYVCFTGKEKEIRKINGFLINNVFFSNMINYYDCTIVSHKKYIFGDSDDRNVCLIYFLVSDYSF